MGDIADYYHNHQIDEDIKREMELLKLEEESKQIVENYKLGVLEWSSANGTKTLIQNIEYTHLKNIHNYLKNGVKNDKTKVWMFVIECEIKKRLPGLKKEAYTMAGKYGMLVYTKKDEYKRSIEMFEQIYKEKGLYFALALLHDSSYGNEDLRAMMDLCVPTKEQMEKIRNNR